MLSKFIHTLQSATPEELYNISLLSAQAKNKQVHIFEKGKMSDLFWEDRAEKIRQEFLHNNVQVKQITNIPELPKFSENDDFVNTLMSFRYVSQEIFDIDNEILIFDDTVAIYNQKELLIIQEWGFAGNYRQLFSSIWEQWQPPALWFEYVPNHSFYNNLNYYLDNGVQIIVWPDCDAVESFSGLNEAEVGSYIKNIIENEPKYYADSSYIICFIWSLDGEQMVDVWKFNENHVDDRSGPLSEVRVYREWKICNNLGLASGNTLLVLWYEEKMRRQSQNLQDYLDGPVPQLPLEVVNKKNFFEYN